jgi:hypothetical protein
MPQVCEETRLSFTGRVLSRLDIQRQCAVFLASHLEPANCLGIYCFADLHNCSQLKQAGLKIEAMIDAHRCV